MILNLFHSYSVVSHTIYDFPPPVEADFVCPVIEQAQNDGSVFSLDVPEDLHEVWNDQLLLTGPGRLILQLAIDPTKYKNIDINDVKPFLVLTSSLGPVAHTGEEFKFTPWEIKSWGSHLITFECIHSFYYGRSAMQYASVLLSKNATPIEWSDVLQGLQVDILFT